MYGQTSIDAVGQVDRAFVLILGFSVFMLLVITALMIYFIFRYSRKRHPEAADITGSGWLEVVWTVIPTLIVLLMFYFGWSSFRALRTVPKNAMEVTVKARMWSWVFEYPNGIVSNQLYVPENKPVKLNLTSLDVIHSFYVPAFRIKMDCVPGMKTYAWFNADKTGDYDILCAEYCGARHAYMLSKVHVMEDADYEAWIQKESGVASGVTGKKVYEKYSCSDCNTMDGTSDIAPALNNIAGTTQIVMVNGKEKSITVDADYLKRSIMDPEAEIVKGFQPMMPPFKGEMSKEELNALVKFLLKGEGKAVSETKGIDTDDLVEEQGCLSCHSTDGSVVAGPSFKGIFGRKTVVLRDGKEVTITVDDAYLRTAILNPGKDIVKGFDPIMPTFDSLSEKEVQAIIDWLQKQK